MLAPVHRMYPAKPTLPVLICSMSIVVACDGATAPGAPAGIESDPAPSPSSAGVGAPPEARTSEPSASAGGAQDSDGGNGGARSTSADIPFADAPAGSGSGPSQPDADESTMTNSAATPESQANGVPMKVAPPGPRDSEPASPEVVPAGKVPAMIGQGDMGRSVMSCDDGRTWVADRAFDSDGDHYACGEVQSARCGGSCRYLDDGSCASSGTCDCWHHPGAARGIAYGDGWFVATWGWGPDGGVSRSRDGVTWTRVIENSQFGAMAGFDGQVILGDRDPRVSADGERWTTGGEADLRSPGGEDIYSVRSMGAGAAPDGTGRFLLTGEDGGARDVLLSSNAGQTWWRPTTLPEACASTARGVGFGGGNVIILHESGQVCYSHDGGTTFATSHVGDYILSRTPAWTGTHFMAYGQGLAFSSEDGKTWSSDSTTPSMEFGVVTANPVTGTLVTVVGGYESQRFYRSTDGIHWTEAESYPASHPINFIAFGYVDAGELCE